MDAQQQKFELAIKETFPNSPQYLNKNPDGTYRNTTTFGAWIGWKLAAKAQAVPEGFVLVSAEQLSQWGHMANCAEEYGCPECFEARGYAHSLACEINAYFNVSDAQEPAND